MIQNMLAEMASKVHAARLMVYYAAWCKDTGKKKFTKEAAMAKYYAATIAVDVTRQATQIYGGYGYTKDYAVERYYRDAKILEIYEGTMEVQKIVIAGELVK
jgi:butyryl-CoA dehydrogenase